LAASTILVHSTFAILLMDEKTFSLVAGAIFAVVALFHLVRIFMEWTVIIGDWSYRVGELDRPRCRWWPRFFRV
jgi:hypothetical protein